MRQRTPPPTMKQPDRKKAILNHLETLGVPLSEAQLDHFLHEGEKGGWSYLELLDHLFADQAATKGERMIAQDSRRALHGQQNVGNLRLAIQCPRD